MKEKAAKVRIRLDRTRLLGFDQVPVPDGGSEPALRRARLTRLGSKVGGKLGRKPA